jgi:tetratricopeptide (TPR) repeat protein
MSWTLLGWLLIVSAIALSAQIIVSQWSKGLRWREAAGLPLPSRLRLSSVGLGHRLRGSVGTLVVAAAVFLLVAGVGVVTSHVRPPPETAAPGSTTSVSVSHSGLDGETLAGLEDYARSIGTEEPVSVAAAGELLPDVDTMIGRLAARLESAPENVDGWRMLGWSYLNTGRYGQAAAAYARAVELDPDSAELKSSYEEAEAKASESDNLVTAAALQSESAAGNGDDEPSGGKTAISDAMPPHERDAAIRAMVDGLAHRLESSPRDVEGWTRLMRSRVVLGETEVAATAFRKALEVFRDDAEASARITAAATELGLKAE